MWLPNGSDAARATGLAVVHAVASALACLRAGLTVDAARDAAGHVRTLLDAPAVALSGGDGVLAWDGPDVEEHAGSAGEHARYALAAHDPQVHPSVCGRADCPVREVVVTALVVEERAVGGLCVYVPAASAALLRATADVAGCISGVLELARLRTRLADTEMTTLRARLSPHFLFNSLTAIVSIIDVDPREAKDLLQAFSDVVRYSLLRHAGLATLDEELRAISPYLALEQARFSDRLRITVDVAPDVLPVVVPFLSLQPLVDNAIRHGMERKAGTGRISVLAAPAGAEVRISVADDGVGLDADRVRELLTGADTDEADVGLASLHRRLRLAFGEEYGLVVRSAPGAGTTVSMRVPRTGP